MPVDVDATWANAPDAGSAPLYDAIDLRRADAALIAGRGVALGVRGGIVPHGSTSLAVAVDGSDQITVQPGAVIIPDDASAGAGPYRSSLPSVHAEQLTARHATFSRIDRVVFRMLDPDVVGTHTVRTGRLEVIPGTPSSSPTVPARPSLAVELARITVPPTSGGAPSVDSTWREFACAPGGELLVPTFNRLPTAAAPWQRARAMDTGIGFVRVGSMWVPDRLTGTLTIAINSVHAQVPVNFPYPFDTPPVVVANCTNWTFYNAFAGTPTTSGFSAGIRHTADAVQNVDAEVQWVAYRR